MPDAQSLSKMVERFDHHDPLLGDDETRSRVLWMLRNQYPVHYTESHGGFWVVSRYADVAEVARNHDIFVSRYGVTIPGTLPDSDIPVNQAPPTMDPPMLLAVRKMLMPWFTPQAARAKEDVITQLTDDLLDGLSLSSEDGEIDLAEGLAVPLPALFMLRLMGLPEEMWKPLTKILHSALNSPLSERSSGPNPADLSSFSDSLKEVFEIAAERRRNPKDDLLTHLVHAQIGGQPLDSIRLESLVTVILGAGLDTTANAIGSSLIYLGTHPEARQQLIHNPALISTAVEEFLRMWPPFPALARYVTDDCRIGRQEIKKGDRVLLSWTSANRDESAFEDAETVDIERSPNRHFTFGTGIHRCIGSNYARSVLRIAIERMLNRFPSYRVIEDRLELHADISILHGYKKIPAMLKS
jgi:cytochrome P450